MSKSDLDIRWAGYSSLGEADIVGIFEVSLDTESSMLQIFAPDRGLLTVEGVGLAYDHRWDPDIEWPEPYDRDEHMRRVEEWARNSFSRWLEDLLALDILIQAEADPTRLMPNPEFVPDWAHFNK